MTPIEQGSEGKNESSKKWGAMKMGREVFEFDFNQTPLEKYEATNKQPVKLWSSMQFRYIFTAARRC